MAGNEWVAVHPDRGFRELLEAVAEEGLEALDAFKHKQIELNSLENAFFISQRILQKTRDILGEDDPAFMDMLIRSIDGCLEAGYMALGFRQAEYAREILEKQGATRSPEYQYAVGAMAFCHMSDGRFGPALDTIELLMTLQDDAPRHERLSTRMDRAAALAGTGASERAKAACVEFTADLLRWGREAAETPGGDTQTAHSLCAYALDVCMSVLTVQGPDADAEWALNALLAFRGLLYRLDPAASTVHAADNGAYRRARASLPEGGTFRDCVRFNDLVNRRAGEFLFYEDAACAVRAKRLPDG